MIAIKVTMISIEKVNTSFDLFLHDFSADYNYTRGRRKKYLVSIRIIIINMSLINTTITIVNILKIV